MTALNPVLTVGDQITEVIKLHEKCSSLEAAAKAKEMLEMVGIPSREVFRIPPSVFGRHEAARGHLDCPGLPSRGHIADEPTTALDVTIQAQVLELMTKLKKEIQTSMILITHDLGVVARNLRQGGHHVCRRNHRVRRPRGHLRQHRPPLHHPPLRRHPRPREGRGPARAHPGPHADPSNLAPGCRFCPRCANRKPICETTPPPEVEVTPGHMVKCHLYKEGGLA